MLKALKWPITAVMVAVSLISSSINRMSLHHFAPLKLRRCQIRAPVFVDERVSDSEIKESIVAGTSIAAILHEINRTSA